VPSDENPPPPGPIRILMLGAPGSGKGTQGARLAERYDARHVSTGDLLRAAVAEGTELGGQAQPYMDRGDLVPDELILEMVLEHVLGPDSSPSFVLDGFPRTVSQAKAAYERASTTDRTLDAVVWLDLDQDLLLGRLEQRGLESGRADDAEATILHRIHEYERLTRPLLRYYDGRDLLVRVDAAGEIDDIFAAICEPLDAILEQRQRRGQ
jgi:adenylate kinase